MESNEATHSSNTKHLFLELLITFLTLRKGSWCTLKGFRTLHEACFIATRCDQALTRASSNSVRFETFRRKRSIRNESKCFYFVQSFPFNSFPNKSIVSLQECITFCSTNLPKEVATCSHGLPISYDVRECFLFPRSPLAWIIWIGEASEIWGERVFGSDFDSPTR